MVEPERVLEFDNLLAEFQWLMDIGLNETAYLKVSDISELLSYRVQQDWNKLSAGSSYD